MGLLHREITQQVIEAFYEVYNSLGYGFLESVYSRALAVELRRRGLRADREVAITVRYKREDVGVYRADLLVEARVIVEVKASRLLDPSAYSQLVHYLKATGLEVGVLLHFAPDPSFKRVILSAPYRAR
jgi:GxxExxY protein